MHMFIIFGIQTFIEYYIFHFKLFNKVKNIFIEIWIIIIWTIYINKCDPVSFWYNIITFLELSVFILFNLYSKTPLAFSKNELNTHLYPIGFEYKVSCNH